METKMTLVRLLDSLGTAAEAAKQRGAALVSAQNALKDAEVAFARAEQEVNTLKGQLKDGVDETFGPGGLQALVGDGRVRQSR